MSRLRQEHPKSFEEFVHIVEGMRSSTKHPLWYRGVKRRTYPLLPTLYRRRMTTKIEDFAQVEHEVTIRFHQRSIPFQIRTPEPGWDTMFLMQHHGVPTRLLDWTESPVYALFFAVVDVPHKPGQKRGKSFEEDAAVWILNPVEWNRHALTDQGFKDGVLSPDNPVLNGYLNLKDHINMRNNAVALFGAHNSPRIVAQRGVFAILGKETLPMEKAFIRERFPNDSLTKIVIGKSRLSYFQEAVSAYGITDSVLFPDLEGLAREIKRSFRFEM